MRNVILHSQAYSNFRAWSREQADLLWRDLRSASMIPSWGECVCDVGYMYGDETAGQLAFRVLKTAYPNLKLSWRKEELELLAIKTPKLFISPYVGELHYVDLKAAYCSLYRRLFLHSDWPMKRFKYPLESVASELQELKLARNAIVGITISTRNKWVKGLDTWYTLKRNNYLSPTLWGQIQAILNQIAIKAEREGAIYINTDGYCFTEESRAIAFRQFLTDYEFRTELLQGHGEIRGISACKIFGVKEPVDMPTSKAVRAISEFDYNFLDHWRKLK